MSDLVFLLLGVCVGVCPYVRACGSMCCSYRVQPVSPLTQGHSRPPDPSTPAPSTHDPLNPWPFKFSVFDYTCETNVPCICFCSTAEGKAGGPVPGISCPSPLPFRDYSIRVKLMVLSYLCICLIQQIQRLGVSLLCSTSVPHYPRHYPRPQGPL